MAHLGKVSSVFPETNTFMESMGYKLAESCSQLSCWRRPFSHGISSEIFISKNYRMEDLSKFLDYVCECGYQTGKTAGRNEVKCHITHKIEELLNL